METFAALADPTRRKIVELLAQQGPLSATQIGENFDMTPPAISQHLKVLREANLVQMEKRAQQRIYRLNPQVVEEIGQWATRLARQWEERFDALERVLQVEKERYQKEKPE